MFNVPAVFALRGSPGEKKMAVLGHWGGDGKSFSRLAKLFLTTSGPAGRQAGRRLLGLGTFRLFVVLLFRSMIGIISNPFFSCPLHPQLFFLSCFSFKCPVVPLCHFLLLFEKFSLLFFHRQGHLHSRSSPH